MNIKYIWLHTLVFAMKYMMRYVPFVARPIVYLHAKQEVLACGLRDIHTGNVSIIYTPQNIERTYLYYKKENVWKEIEIKDEPDFSHGLVKKVLITHAFLGDMYIVRGLNIHNKTVASSPSITIKERTVVDNTFLNVFPHSGGTIMFNWKKAKIKNTMIYFLILENADNNKGIISVYSVENSWKFPYFKKVLLTIGKKDTTVLKRRTKYKATLFLVDFDGWVSHMAVKEFSIQ